MPAYSKTVNIHLACDACEEEQTVEMDCFFTDRTPDEMVQEAIELIGWEGSGGMCFCNACSNADHDREPVGDVPALEFTFDWRTGTMTTRLVTPEDGGLDVRG
jgi:hypothetical protein